MEKVKVVMGTCAYANLMYEAVTAMYAEAGKICKDRWNFVVDRKFHKILTKMAADAYAEASQIGYDLLDRDMKKVSFKRFAKDVHGSFYGILTCER